MHKYENIYKEIFMNYYNGYTVILPKEVFLPALKTEVTLL